ncbi:MAG: hypothetical protein R3229_02940 [Alphaproteobacteria bacterium]|nr:hypothetical protein [Alphaproteobacteria bacterium]
MLMIVFGLGALIGYQVYGTPQATVTEPPPPAASPSAKSQPLPEIDYPPKRAFARIVDENLFHPERRPNADDGPERTPAPTRLDPGKPAFALKGVVITPAERTALIKLPRESGYRIVAKGEKVEGWVIEAIESDGIVVKKEGTSTKVKLAAPKATGARTPRRRTRTPRRERRR